MNINNASRTDIRNFQLWTKTLPKSQTSFLYQSYLKEEDRQAKLIELFTQYTEHLQNTKISIK